jgi:23S rRNA (pseudouridine1915-N3)-methyltransferase
MKYKLIALGAMKNGPEKTLLDSYLKRLTLDFSIQEIVPKKTMSKEDEGELILNHIHPSDFLIALDEKGEDLSTRAFFDLIENRIIREEKTCVFVIGGADGLGENIKKRSQLKISFGRMTWPHMLVRALLIEQLYRCQQIKNNHPYHRD